MKVVNYSERKHKDALERFFAECEVENNASMDAMGFYKRPNAMMFLVMDDDRVINTSYVHDFSEYYPDTYRVFTRTATLPSYRTVGVIPRRDMTSAAGVAALTTTMQVDYALINGAKNVMFTTNTSSGGMASSTKLGRFLTSIERQDPRFEFVEEREIYGVDQMVWRLNFRDIMSDPPRDKI